jgi:hypothetical protein
MQMQLLLLYLLGDPNPAATPATNALKPIEWMTLVALVVGPMLAVGTQLWWQRRKEKRDHKIWVFSTLMSLRANMLAPDSVRALNLIDVVFYKNAKVRARWKTMLDYLASDDWKAQPVAQTTLDKTKDFQAELLAQIAKDLGYKYDHTHIKQNAYYPKVYNLLDEDNTKLRRLGIQVLDGKASINVVVQEPPH